MGWGTPDEEDYEHSRPAHSTWTQLGFAHPYKGRFQGNRNKLGVLAMWKMPIGIGYALTGALAYSGFLTDGRIQIGLAVVVMIATHTYWKTIDRPFVKKDLLHQQDPSYTKARGQRRTHNGRRKGVWWGDKWHGRKHE